MQWFIGKEEEVENDGIKFVADHAYACRRFGAAIQHYRQIQASQSAGSPLWREALESKVRTLIRMKRAEEGQNEALELLKATNPANLEHMTNVLHLLVHLYSSMKKFRLEAASLIALISLHSGNPNLWTRLSHALEFGGDQASAVLCSNRAQTLKMSAEKHYPNTFKSSGDLMSRSAQTETTEFRDLGSSQLRKQKEAEIDRRAALMAKENHPPDWIVDFDKLERYIQSFCKLL